MTKNMRKVIGSYNKSDDVTSEINRLMEEGYNRESIYLYTSPTQADEIRTSQYRDNETENVREDAEVVIDEEDIQRKEKDTGREEVGGEGISQETFERDGRESVGREDTEDIDRVAREEERRTDYDDTSDRIEDDDNRSAIDNIADAFTLDVYDYRDESKNPNYNEDDDILYPYREDIAKGNSVIVVDNYRGNMV